MLLHQQCHVVRSSVVLHWLLTVGISWKSWKLPLRTKGTLGMVCISTHTDKMLPTGEINLWLWNCIQHMSPTCKTIRNLIGAGFINWDGWVILGWWGMRQVEAVLGSHCGGWDPLAARHGGSLEVNALRILKEGFEGRLRIESSFWSLEVSMSLGNLMITTRHSRFHWLRIVWWET